MLTEKFASIPLFVLRKYIGNKKFNPKSAPVSLGYQLLLTHLAIFIIMDATQPKKLNAVIAEQQSRHTTQVWRLNFVIRIMENGYVEHT